MLVSSVAFIFAFALVFIGALAMLAGARYALTSSERSDRAGWAIAPGIVMILVGFVFYLSVLIPPIVCPDGTQKVRNIRQYGTGNTVTVCLTPDQITTFLAAQSRLEVK